MLLLRSSSFLHSNLYRVLRSRGCSTRTITSITSTHYRTLRSPFSLLVFSIVLPSKGKFTLYHRLHRRNVRAPVLFLATYSSRLRVIHKLSDNTSSCIAGPFGLRRLLSHVHTLLHHKNDSMVGDSRIILSATRVAICGGNISIFTAGARFRVLTVLVGGDNFVIAESALLRGV